MTKCCHSDPSKTFRILSFAWDHKSHQRFAIFVTCTTYFQSVSNNKDVNAHQ